METENYWQNRILESMDLPNREAFNKAMSIEPESLHLNLMFSLFFH